MQFNPDPNKQANEVIFSRKQYSNNLSYPPIKFNNNNQISNLINKKILKNCFRFKTQHQCPCRSKNCNRILGFIRRVSISLPRNALLTIYKSFVRPHLDYGEKI